RQAGRDGGGGGLAAARIAGALPLIRGPPAGGADQPPLSFGVEHLRDASIYQAEVHDAVDRLPGTGADVQGSGDLQHLSRTTASPSATTTCRERTYSGSLASRASVRGNLSPAHRRKRRAAGAPQASRGQQTEHQPT